MTISTIRKALAAALTAAIATGVTAFPDGFTEAEVATVVGASLVAGLAVWRTPNAPKDVPPSGA